MNSDQIRSCSQSDFGAESESDGRAGHLDPDCQGIIADLLSCEALSVGHRSWNCDRDGGCACVAVGRDGDSCDSGSVGRVARERVRHLGCAGIAGHAGGKGRRDIIVLETDQGPVDETRHLWNNGLHPDLDKSVLLGHAVQGPWISDSAAQVGCGELVEGPGWGGTGAYLDGT